MKNTIEKGTVRFLIYKRNDKFIGICKEFGFIEEAETSKQVKDKLVRGSILLLETVAKNPHLEPSLNTSLPFKYNLIFYFLPILSIFSSWFSTFKGNLQLGTFNIGSQAYA